MIPPILYFFLISHLFDFNHAEPILGENVYPAASENFPFIASLGYINPDPRVARVHICGGSLITKRHVLTCEHCLTKYTKTEIDVIIGQADLRIPSVRYGVASWMTYDEWAPGHSSKHFELPINDIAIITLNSIVDRTDTKPIVLTSLNNERIYGLSAMMAGWGFTDERAGISDVLNRARVTILSIEQCRKELRLTTNKNVFVGPNYLCSSATPYVLTGCGDSGGPLIGQNNVLLGIIRSTCPNEREQWGDFPVEFLNEYKVNLHPNVDYYREFIESETGLVTRSRNCIH